MYSGAIYWSNVRRFVYGLCEEGLYEMAGNIIEDVFILPCRKVFATGHKKIEIVGPILEEEARRVHEGFGVNKSKF